jgi:hypothetical protein
MGSGAIHQLCEGDQQCEMQKHDQLVCGELTCIFIGSPPVQNIKPDQSASPAVILPIPHNCLFPAEVVRGEYMRTVGDIPPPIRLHLVHQILLI